MQKRILGTILLKRKFETALPIFHELKNETIFKIFLDQLLKETIDQLPKKSQLSIPNEEQFSQRRCTKARKSKIVKLLLVRTNGLHRSFSQGIKTSLIFNPQTNSYLTI